MNWTTEQALEYWQKKGLLTAKKAEELRDALSTDSHMSEHGMPRAVSIFATIGAVLVGLGILLFIGSHWANMTPLMRIVVLITGYCVVALAAFTTEKRQWNRTSEALWLLTDIVFGANIMLLAQIFHYSLTYWQGPFLWMIGTLAMGYARQERVHAYLAVPLGILALGWIDSGPGWFIGGQMNFLGSANNILPVLSLLGMGLIFGALLAKDTVRWNFLSEALQRYGMILSIVPVLISTMDISIPKEIFSMGGTAKQYIIIVCTYGLSVLIFWKNMISKTELKVYTLTTLALFGILLLQRGGQSIVGYTLENNSLLYFLYVLVVFAFSLWSVWLGMLIQSAKLFNIGIFATALIIVIQYFSWTFILLDKSLAFILGGILLIVMTIFIEKKRRSVLSSFDS